ncbi:peptidylprolyl isomerase [Alcanivorax sp. 1008]|uniref:peptidylprolyl isomerase n=1 Tax=Alcanivorax sp. 1008 TaxID=2816853 RepID=UPI001E07E951|nr:peptidylprolyl isomerase [Alcanivorax sp. 1008]MCC1497902.1 peptidyl-prolyl cis-trans isomerase [Alcanivorax sp. 1008]
MRWLLAALLSLSLPALADTAPRVELDTSLGKIVLELDAEKAPNSVANFLSYVDEGFYSGTVFHRVIPGFMIQGGGFDQQYQQKPTKAPLANEANNGLRNTRGTIAMARTLDPHSATAQFFINTVDNRSLDHRGQTPDGWGYAVFGKVVEGMDVVDRISSTRTGQGRLNGYPVPDVPIMPVLINSATRIVPPKAEKTTL